VHSNVTFKKKDVTDDGDTPDPEPTPTPIKELPEELQEPTAKKRRSWTSDDPEYKESQDPVDKRDIISLRLATP